MTMEISIKINVSNDEGYTDLEAGIVAALAGGTTVTQKEVRGLVIPPLKEEYIPVQPAAPAEEAQAPKRTRRTKAQIEADKAAEEAAAAPQAAADEPEAEPDEAPVSLDDIVADPGYTAADAVAKATEVLAAGGSAKVKAALAAVGTKRVSELKGASIEAFITALEG